MPEQSMQTNIAWRPASPLSRALSAAGWIALAAALYQVARFWRGDIGLPGADQVAGLIGVPLLRVSIMDVGVWQSGMAACAGLVYWCGVAVTARLLSVELAAVADLGMEGWRARAAELRAADRRREELTRYKELRRQARQRRKSEGAWWLVALLAGMAIGMVLL